MKALQAALYGAKLYGSAVGSTHPVNMVVSAIRSAAPTWPKAIKSQRIMVMNILSDDRLRTIKVLDSLAPRYPAPGTLPKGNTEYPYQEIAGADAWKAPAEVEAFSKNEIKRFLQCAQRIQYSIDKVVIALELAYP